MPLTLYELLTNNFDTSGLALSVTTCLMSKICKYVHTVIIPLHAALLSCTELIMFIQQE